MAKRDGARRGKLKQERAYRLVVAMLAGPKPTGRALSNKNTAISRGWAQCAPKWLTRAGGAARSAPVLATITGNFGCTTAAKRFGMRNITSPRILSMAAPTAGFLS